MADPADQERAVLIQCPACGHDISTQANSCPNCGHPVRPPEPEPLLRIPTKRPAPVFVVLAGIGLFLSLSTPRLFLFIPLMVTFGSAVISLFRKERGRVVATIILVLAVGLFLLNESGFQRSANLNAAEITDWNWQKDTSYGTHGMIRWNVQVHNKTSRNISSIRVNLTTYDSAGKLVASAFTYVPAIPAEQTRSEASFADLYGTEHTANVQITEVRFSE